jgi:Ras-related protein Rab-11A
MRFCKNKFNANPKATIGVEMMKKVLKIEIPDHPSQYVGAHIWDTAGQERYKALSSLYFKGAVGALLVFDLTSRESFENVIDWIKLVKEKADTNVVIILIGNKSDLVESRQVK